MVGPVSDDERQSFTRRLQVGFVLLVGISAGLITLQGDPSPAVVAGAVVGGLVVGRLLVRFAVPDSAGFRGRDRPERTSESASDGHLERRFDSEKRESESRRERRNR